nr:MAG TPA_asm: hypothetical protein [Caudoviricetes sp.]
MLLAFSLNIQSMTNQNTPTFLHIRCVFSFHHVSNHRLNHPCFQQKIQQQGY